MPEPDLFHVDVFATAPLTGNGLTVFLGTEGWPVSVMQRLTQEMRQFESIFLSAITPDGATARVFTVEEELPFAGHPVLGAAAVLHRTQAPSAAAGLWEIKLTHKSVTVRTNRLGASYLCEMNQGTPDFGSTVPPAALEPILTRLGLDATDVPPGLEAQVVSTGLPYLIVPVNQRGLAKAKISGTDLEQAIEPFGAKFVLFFAPEAREMRTWDNLGQVEDVATGSAAGPAAAYLFDRGLASPDATIELAQGRFAGRPSKLKAHRDQSGNLFVSGEVWPVSHGALDLDPAIGDPE